MASKRGADDMASSRFKNDNEKLVKCGFCKRRPGIYRANDNACQMIPALKADTTGRGKWICRPCDVKVNLLMDAYRGEGDAEEQDSGESAFLDVMEDQVANVVTAIHALDGHNGMWVRQIKTLETELAESKREHERAINSLKAKIRELKLGESEDEEPSELNYYLACEVFVVRLPRALGSSLEVAREYLRRRVAEVGYRHLPPGSRIVIGPGWNPGDESCHIDVAIGEGDEEHASVVFLMAMKEATERFHAEMHVKAINEGCTLLKLDTEAVRALTRQVEDELFADHFPAH